MSIELAMSRRDLLKRSVVAGIAGMGAFTFSAPLLASTGLLLPANYANQADAAAFWAKPRVLNLYRPATGEHKQICYWRDGHLDLAGYREACHMLRDVRAGKATEIDLRLLNLLRGQPDVSFPYWWGGLLHKPSKIHSFRRREGSILGTLVGKVLSPIALAAFASHAAAAETAEVTPVESYLMSKGNAIVQAFPAASGMKGIVVDNGAEKRLFYVTPDGKSLLAGVMFDTQGANLTSVDLARTASVEPVPQSSQSAGSLAQAWKQAEQLKWLAEGDADRVMYAFFDPNCAYCHELWGMLRAPVAAGDVQVRWIPISILRASSNELNAAIYQQAATEGVLVPMAEMAKRQLQPATVTEGIRQSLADNLALFRQAGFRRTPMILYRDKDQVKVFEGAPLPQKLAMMLKKE
ncbi:TPA: thiol:disulfide interchange protein DsbG [Pseudomonas aeruginosa]